MKASGLKPPMKIERPCSSSQPRPAVPTSPPKPSMNSMEHLWETHGRRLSEAGLRRGSDNSVVLTEDTDSFIIGDRVWVGGTKPGQIAYIGETQFAPGDWAGIVLDEPIGKNDGSVAGCRYFQCEPKRGIFSRLTRLTRYPMSSVECPLARSKTPTSSPQDSKRGSLNKTISPSLNTSTSSLASVSHRELRLGERVIISSSQGSKTGVLRYLGTTEFANGEWCGVELDDPHGKNDGSVEGKRYFECRPKYGLFAPLHKVSRSPSSKNKMCMIHRPTGASQNASLKRIGSKESLASISSIGSTATSVSRAATSTTRRSGLRTATPARSTLQDMLKEKQQEVDVLKKERNLERERVIKAAGQADIAEQSLSSLKQEYEKYRAEHVKTAQETQISIASLLEKKNLLSAQLEEEKRKCEDLLFRFEEESINKDDIQVVNTQNESKIKELEQLLAEERERVVQLEKDSTKLFETEEELTRLRTEVQVLNNQNDSTLQDILNRYKILEESNTLIQKELFEKNATLQKYVSQIHELQESLSKKCEESSSHKDLELSHQKAAEETKKLLDEKSALFDIMQKEHEIECENWQKELRHLQENMERLKQQKDEEGQNLLQENQKKLQEKDDIIKAEIEKLKEANVKSNSVYIQNVEKLKSENDNKIKQITEAFEVQLKEKADAIQKLTQQFEEKLADCDKLTKELSETQSIHKTKDEHEKETLKLLEELTNKIDLFEERCSVLLHEEDAVQCEIECELRKFYNDYANMAGYQMNPSTQAELNTKRDKIELKQLPDIENEQFEKLKNNVKLRYSSNLKLIKEMISIISRKDTRIETLEKNVTELKNIALNKDGEIKILFDKTTELQDILSLSEETKSNLESELKMHETNLEDLKRKLLRAEEKITMYMDDKQKSELDAANAISTSADLSDQLKKYNEDIRKKEKELDEARDKEFQLTKSVDSLQNKLDKTDEELKKAATAIQQLESEKKQLISDAEQINKNHETLSNDFKTKESQLISTNNLLNQKIKELNELLQNTNSSIESLKNENKSKDKIIEENKKEIEKLTNECLNKEQSHENSNMNMKNLQENLVLKENEVQKLQIEIENEKKETEIINSEIKNKSEELAKIVAEKKSLEETHNNTIQELGTIKELFKQKENEIANFNEIIKSSSAGADVLQNEIFSLQTKLKAEINEKNVLLNEKSLSQETEKIAKTELSSLKNLLQEKDNLVKNMENTIEVISQSKDRAIDEMKKGMDDDLKAKIKIIEEKDAQKKELEDRISSIEDLDDKKNFEINNLKEQIATLKKSAGDEKQKTEEALTKKNETVQSEKERLEQEKISLEKLIKNYEEKLNASTEAFKSKDLEFEKNMLNFVEKINNLNEQNVKLKESHSSLEKEYKELMSKYMEVTENLKLTQENIKNNSNTNDKILSNSTVQKTVDTDINSDTLNQLTNLQEENESSKMQIDFLNSVIVEMQRKNEKLQCKIEVLEMGIPSNEADDYNRSTIEKKSAPPRIFCDICDQFDLHETEDCHRQEQDFQEQEKLPKGEKKIPAPRPYCETCEEFGHDTHDCNDAETF